MFDGCFLDEDPAVSVKAETSSSTTNTKPNTGKKSGREDKKKKDDKAAAKEAEAEAARTAELAKAAEKEEKNKTALFAGTDEALKTEVSLAFYIQGLRGATDPSLVLMGGQDADSAPPAKGKGHDTSKGGWSEETPFVKYSKSFPAEESTSEGGQVSVARSVSKDFGYFVQFRLEGDEPHMSEVSPFRGGEDGEVSLKFLKSLEMQPNGNFRDFVALGAVDFFV